MNREEAFQAAGYSAVVALQAGAWTRALEMVKLAEDLAVGSFELALVSLTRAQLFFRLDQFEEALATIDLCAGRMRTCHCHPLYIAGMNYTRAQILLALGRNDEALETIDLCTTQRQEASAPKIELAQTCYTRSHILRELGRFPDALEAISQCIALNFESKAPLDEIARGTATFADILNRLGRFREALTVIEACASQEEMGQAPLLQVAGTTCTRAQTLLGLGQFEDALKAIQLCANQQEIAQAPLVEIATTTITRAHILRNLGRPLEALGEIELCAAQLEEARASLIKVALASYVRADILKDLGRLDEALDGFDRAVTQADRVQATPEQALRWRAVALSVCAQIHGWDQVQPRLDDLAARLRTELLMETDEVRRSRLGAMILPLIEAQALEHALAEPGTAWQLLEQARSITFRAGMMEVRGANRITAHRRTLEEKLAESRALHARTRPTEEELRRRTEIGDEVLRAREALKAEIGRVAGDLAMVQPGDVPEGWLHLVYLVGEEISVVLAADRNGVQAVELQSRSLPIGLHPARSEDGSLTRDGWRLRLPDSVHRGLWNRDGDWLGSVLVPQEIRPRIAAAQRVILTVGNPLLDIVFDHLVDEEGRRLFRTGQVQPGESLTTVLESRRALGELRHSGDPIFFGVADHGDLPSDPETEPEPSDPAEPTDPEDRSAVSVRFSGAEKRNLPWVAEELRCIAGMYGVEPILNGAARAEGFAEALAEGRRLVGLSTHAAFDPGDPFRSVLAVHDPAEGRPFITLRRLLDLARGTGFRTRLLTLNCCMTALSGLGADGYVSIQYLLRRHGVQAVLATRWSVVDQAACVLQVRLQEILRDGLPLGEALARLRDWALALTEADLTAFADGHQIPTVGGLLEAVQRDCFAYVAYGSPRTTLT